MIPNLMEIRWKALFYELIGYLSVGILGFLTSEDFRELVVNYTGEITAFTVISTIAYSILKHVRNKTVAKNLGRLSATAKGDQYFI